MSNEQETYNQIDQYLTGKMTSQEKASFEQNMANDVDLRDAVEMHKMLQATAISHELDQLHSQIGTDLDRIRSKSIIKKWLMIGAAGLALIATVSILIPRDKKKSSELTNVNEEVRKTKKVHEDHPLITEEEIKEKVKPVKTDIHEGIVQTTEKNEFIPPEDEVEIDTLLSDEVNNKDIEKVIEVISTDKQSDNVEVEQEQLKTPPPPCPGNRVDLKYKMTSQSLDGIEGSIRVENVISEGFKEPVRYKLLDIDDTYSTLKVFNGLEADDYTIGIIDANGCEALSPIITVTPSSCVKEYPETFSPAYDYEWRLRINEDLDATIVLKNKAGKVILLEKVIGEREFIWNGHDNNGTTIDEPGYIWFFVTYSNGETCSGGFNLIR